MIQDVARPVLLSLAVAGASFVACQVYDASLLRGSGGAGRGEAGTGATSGTGGFSAGGSGAAGATSGGAGSGGEPAGGTSGIGEGGSSMTDAGAGGEGEEPAGGSGGTSGGTSGASGAAGGGGTSAGGQGGSAGGGAGGKGGSAGTPASGGAGTGAGGAGTGGGGTSGSSGSGGGPTEVELTGTATADSEQNTTNNMHPASHGNDGDLVTRWCAANGNANHFWTLDLGDVHEVTRFEVTWEYPTQAEGLPYLYRIDISNDGTTFTPSIDKTANEEVTPTQIVSFPPGTMARHVRIVVTGLPMGPSATWASFYEASVYGY